VAVGVPVEDVLVDLWEEGELLQMLEGEAVD